MKPERISEDRLSDIRAGFGFEEDIIAELISALDAERSWSKHMEDCFDDRSRRIGELRDAIKDQISRWRNHPKPTSGTSRAEYNAMDECADDLETLIANV